jgi:hypothetical protein
MGETPSSEQGRRETLAAMIPPELGARPLHYSARTRCVAYLPWMNTSWCVCTSCHKWCMRLDRPAWCAEEKGNTWSQMYSHAAGRHVTAGDG